ncbi:MAG TPA: adenylate/guanylate cyclase domain-containing protein [Gaiellaceae bacterium]|nr:adenylate/guanylate cyclase domain-containing protein [Gaiellaceae bacterium]
MAACTTCGAENREGRKFCAECGELLATLCPSCGAANEPGERFCGDCGTALVAGAVRGSAAAPSSPVEAPVAERRLVSVLFADLVGFTTLSESRDAEAVRELLSRYFETCRRLIGLYGGVVEKFIGDAVMAVWGTPVATEDDAERAVRAALDLVAAVSALGDEVGAPDLRARAGVLTGEAAVNLAAVGEGMVAGDLVNTASRIQSVAEPGSVFVGEAARRASERAVVYEEAGSFGLKGKEGETPLWRALRVVSGRGGELRSEGLEAPFVGRDRELRQIKDLFHVCAEEGRAQLVSVSGIAGIGKSRLAWEFYKYFDGLAETVYWHRGRCLAYGEGVTYWALADMVRWRCRIGEDDPRPEALRKLQAALSEHLLDPEERAYVEPRLAQLLGLGEGREAPERQDLFAAWRLFFERLTETYPTILVFEDMQWADASLLDFVEYLLEWSREKPLYVLTLARPELAEKRPTWGTGHRNFTSLYLEPLSEPAMTELLQGLVPGLPGSLQTQILARAEGVPLYAVETVRMLLDRGLLVEDGASYRVAGEVESLEVPETLHALVAARLDSLSGEERHLLQDASVLGKTFTPAALAALTGQVEAELEPRLAGLVRKELLGLQADPRSPEHGQYGFLQDIVRHVAYETLPKRERRARHLAAAEHLSEAFGEEEVAEVVASHLLDAYRLDPDAADAEALKARAQAALVRAGDRAGSVAAATEAQRYFEQAAELTNDARDRASLVDRAGQMAWRAGSAAEARALFDRAHDAFEAVGEVRAASRVSARLGEIDFMEGHPPEALARLEQALAALAGGEEDAELAAVTAQLGRFLLFSGRDEEAAPHLERALGLAEALDLPETLAQAMSSRAVLVMKQDRLFESRVLLEGAIELALANNLHAAALRAYNNLAATMVYSDLSAEGYAVNQRALEHARRVGDRVWEARFVSGAGMWLFFLGRWDEALAWAAEGEQLPPDVVMGGVTFFSVYIHCERGELAQAREQFSSSTAAHESEEAQDVAGHACTEARLLRAEGKLDEAQAAAERALSISRGLGVTAGLFKSSLREALETALEMGDTMRARELLGCLDPLKPGQRTPMLRAFQAEFEARLGAALGESDADARFTSGEALYREHGWPFFEAALEVRHAEWLISQGRGDEAHALLAAARETFERLRAAPWLERVAAAEAAVEAGIPA